MKLIIVQFPDSTDITSIPEETTGITISDGTNTISEGEILAVTKMANPKMIAHVHPQRDSGLPVLPPPSP